MTAPYPPPPPRRLTRSRSDRVLGGVCGGLAEYLNMDPTLVRVLTVLLIFFTGVPLLVYLVAWLVMPLEEQRPPRPGHLPPGQAAYPPYGAAYRGQPARPADPVWGPTGPPWEQHPPAPPAAPAPYDPHALKPWQAGFVAGRGPDQVPSVPSQPSQPSQPAQPSQSEQSQQPSGSNEADRTDRPEGG